MPYIFKQQIICDPEDRERINSQDWWSDKDGRILTHIDGKSIRLHRFVRPGLEYIDHRNGNQLDVRKSNLRAATHVQNMQNAVVKSNSTTGYKGVHPRGKGKYRARIQVGLISHHLGTFTNTVDAAKAYDKAAIKFFGEFACLNFPENENDRQANSKPVIQ